MTEEPNINEEARMKFADAGVCPLVPRGRGLAVKMNYPDGLSQYIPFVPFYEIECFDGMFAMLVTTNDVESVVMLRQKDTDADVEIGPYYLDSSEERITVVSGRLTVYGPDGTREAVVDPGENHISPPGKLRKLVFSSLNDSPALAVVVWRPPLKEINIQTDVCGANREVVES